MAARTNRLAGERSPYLLQHAHNPVDWYPWGPEALERAKREDKPILLSIGYAACHWCHVMERESFENEDIARVMNELFVNVKVDREERPDLDHVYQIVVQLMGKSGGWPLTVFLTPDQKPFFAGTYFPPADRYGMPGFPTLLQAIADTYSKRRGEVEAQAGEIAHEIGRVAEVPRAEGAPGPDLLRKASRRLLARFDSHNGGFGSRPKFPNTMALDVLLARAALEGDAVCRESVELALDRMRQGGIWDHLRGGFHRYSVDARWMVPHFEKMLYDNALLLRLYVDGFRTLGKPRYAETARAIVGYLLAEMRDPSGGFYATQDADSEGQEGKFFVWKLDDLRAAVGDDHAAYDVARVYFGITEEGNFEDTGATVLSEARSLERTAAILDMDVAAARAALDRATEKMLAAREKRPRPSRDDKILAGWNGLLIGALAEAGRALDEPSWIRAAVEAFEALETRLLRDGRLRRYYMAGESEAPAERRGFLDDQAYVGNAALDLYEATGDARFVAVASAIADAMMAHHADRAGGGFFFAPDDGDPLIARTKDVFDQAVPSGVAMAALLCLRLSELSRDDLAEHARHTLEALAGVAIDNPFGMGKTVMVLDRLVRGTVDVVLVGDRAKAEDMARAAFRAFLPHRNVAWIDTSQPSAQAIAKLAEGKPGRVDEVVAYVCRDRACSPPVTTAEALSGLLQAR
jgi:hypothetical protein